MKEYFSTTLQIVYDSEATSNLSIYSKRSFKKSELISYMEKYFVCFVRPGMCYLLVNYMWQKYENTLVCYMRVLFLISLLPQLVLLHALTLKTLDNIYIAEKQNRR